MDVVIIIVVEDASTGRSLGRHADLQIRGSGSSREPVAWGLDEDLVVLELMSIVPFRPG